MDLLAELPTADQQEILTSLTDEEAASVAYDWQLWARPEQLPPSGDWRYWLICAGRGFGKTRAGAEWVRQQIKSVPDVNLIGATVDDARDIMIEGESGILAICPDDERPRYIRNEAKLEWPNGNKSLIFTADKPDRLRGKQHGGLWADELAAWRYPEAWDQAMFGLRLGKDPRACITTTPRPTKIMRELIADQNCIITRGSTYDNRRNLAPAFYEQIVKKYEGTRVGRQELHAEMLKDVVGALWRQDTIDNLRVPKDHVPTMRRVVVAVDPPASSEEGADEAGIIAVGTDEQGEGYVLGDASGVYTPDEWSRQVAALYHRLDADCVIGEKNNGGEMVSHVIRSSLPNARVRLVHASKGKYTRAEPASALYEQSRVHHVGVHEKLEDQMTEFTSDFDRQKNGLFARPCRRSGLGSR